MKVLIVIAIIEGLLILASIYQIIKLKKITTRLIQENAVMWQCLKEKEN